MPGPRRVPHKGKLLAGTAVFGSSFLAAVRWLFGVWLPSAHQVWHAERPCTPPRARLPWQSR
jgi:hypothetical protein